MADDVPDIHDETKVERDFSPPPPSVGAEDKENLEDLFRNILLERSDQIREFVERDPSLRATLQAILISPERTPADLSCGQSSPVKEDIHSDLPVLTPEDTQLLNRSDPKFIPVYQPDDLISEPDPVPLADVPPPQAARQVSYIYTLQNVAELWSIFIDHLYTLVKYDLISVSAATRETPSTHLTPPQPDWVSNIIF